MGSCGPRTVSESGTVLKRISVRDLSLGMFVHAVDGAWLAQPFWRSRFLLNNAGQVEELRRSQVSTVVIDLSRCVGRSRPSPSLGASHQVIGNSNERRADDLKMATRVSSDARRLMKTVFDEARGGEVAVSAEVDVVVRSLAQALDRNRSILLGIMRLKTSDTYTYFHSVAVGTLMINLARELGLPDDQARQMGLGGLFHDIGKITIAKAILHKPARLTPSEFDEVRQHPVRGHEMLVAGGVPPIALDVCLHHHEKIDGSGYPNGLAGGEISLAARMGAICDVYDALTSERPYKSASSPVAALAAMASWNGHFDPDLLFVFMKSIGVFPVGMLIRLRSGHLAVVRDNGRRASRARLEIFYDIQAQRFVSPYALFLSDIDANELIVETPDPIAFGLKDWPGLRSRLLLGFDPSIKGT